MTAPPTVSVIIPAKNEAARLPRVLAALEQIDWPRERLEVLVVDNGSEDDTMRIAAASGARVLLRPHLGLGALRNAGAAASQGTVLAFLDADCIAPVDWLKCAVATLGNSEVGAVGGSCLAPAEGSWVERAWVTAPPPYTRAVEALATSSFITTRAVFDAVGGFNTVLGAGEDDELSARISARGLKLMQVPGCAVIHLGYPRTLWGVARRQLWHGRSQLQAAGDHWGPLLWLTHLFAFALLVLLVTVLAGAPIVAFVALLTTALLSAVAAAVKVRRGRTDWLQALQLTVIYWFFLLGRSAGLVLSYADRWRALRIARA